MGNSSQFNDINKLDYWFLDVVLFMPIGINDLVPDSQGNLGINKKPLDISLAKMSEVMDKLFKKGYLCASKPYGVEGGSSPGNVIKFIPNQDEILQGLHVAAIPEIIRDDNSIIEIHNNLFDFFLTTEGGSVWESFSNPQWNMYFEKYTRYSEHKNQAESWIICPNKKTIEKIISIEHLLDHGGIQSEPISGTDKWEIVSPFHLPYWKIFSSGYRVCYKVEFRELDINSEGINDRLSEFIAIRDDARKWYKNICNNWYINYYNSLDNFERE